MAVSETGFRTFDDLGFIFTEAFVSAEQAATAATTTTVAHGLSGAPKLIQVFTICKTAEFNYSIGDTLWVGTSFQNNSGLLPYIPNGDTTNVVLNTATTSQSVHNKTTWGNSTLTVGNWKFIIHAYY